MKLTRWFGKKVKPVRKGVYETYDYGLQERFYNYFDGEQWHYGARFIDDSLAYLPEPHRKSHSFKWRGILK